MKKILFVLNRLGGGGAERVATLISNKLMEKEIEVQIIVNEEINKTYELNSKIKVTHINVREKNKTIRKIKKILKLRKKIKQYNPDTIIAFEYFINVQTILAALWLRKKIIISERNDPKKSGNSKLIKKSRNILYNFANCLVCQTPDAKAYFSKKIQKKSVIIPNPIMPNLPSRFKGIRKKEIVTFCRVEPQKNLKMMIDAFEMINKEYQDYELIIYGDGSEKSKLKEYIKEKKLESKIKLNNFVQDVHNRIIESSMFVSTSNYEGISNSMLEAMGIGLPTIVTDCPCGGARMMIEDNVNGILVPVGDTIAMYRAMKKVIENPDFANKLSKNAIKINERLEINKICKMWIELI